MHFSPWYQGIGCFNHRVVILVATLWLKQPFCFIVRDITITCSAYLMLKIKRVNDMKRNREKWTVDRNSTQSASLSCQSSLYYWATTTGLECIMRHTSEMLHHPGASLSDLLKEISWLKGHMYTCRWPHMITIQLFIYLEELLTRLLVDGLSFTFKLLAYSRRNSCHVWVV